MKLALHACCGPCLLEPFDALVAEGADEVVVVYANPNIHPQEEYERRRDTLKAYAADAGIAVIELPYDPGSWLEATAHAATREERCHACYRLRLGMVADWAAANGYDALATTLTVSPYQDAEGISQEGERAAGERGLGYLRRDFRDRYGEATRRSRELGMYRQNYCGCGPSQLEAEAERAARRAKRAAEKAARHR